MVFTAYVCQDFELRDNGVLVIFESYAEFTSNDSEMVKEFISNSQYDAVVCPQLYTTSDGRRGKRVLFK